jgi:hypothetical protein
MKKLLPFFASAILIALISWALSFVLPWWSFAFPALVVPFLFKLNPGAGFLSAALGVALLWLAIIIRTDIANGSILSERMAILFGLKSSIFIIITSLLPGIVVSGIFGLSGAGIRRSFTRRKR